MFPTTGFQIIIELRSPEDPPCLGRTSYPTDGATLVCFPRKRKGYLNILFGVVARRGEHRASRARGGAIRRAARGNGTRENTGKGMRRSALRWACAGRNAMVR